MQSWPTYVAASSTADRFRQFDGSPRNVSGSSLVSHSIPGGIAMDSSTVIVAEQPCVRASSDHLVVDVARDVGPRVLGLSRVGSENLFAELPELVLEHRGRLCPLYGGHRLWNAPEDRDRTWVADGSVELSREGLSVRVVGAPRFDGLRKELHVTLADDTSSVSVRHEIHNEGAETRLLALWALTMR